MNNQRTIEMNLAQSSTKRKKKKLPTAPCKKKKKTKASALSLAMQLRTCRDDPRENLSDQLVFLLRHRSDAFGMRTPVVANQIEFVTPRALL